MTWRKTAVNLGCVLTRRPHDATDWKHELAREQVLQLRHERWRTNSIHIFRLARKLAIAWLLLRHGADMSDLIITVTGDSPTLGH
ncbi:MAG: hypothetical protein QOJ46_839 [bacterium]